MKKKLLVLLGLMVLVVVVSMIFSPKKNQKANKSEGEITIVTSFYPMYIATMNLIEGIDHVQLVNLTENQTGCIHDYQLTTKDMKTLEKADIFVMNGAGMESFVGQALNAYPDLYQIDSSVGITLLEGEAHDHEHEHEENHDHAEENHDHADEEQDRDSENDSGLDEMMTYNGHIWMNPSLYEQQIRTITDGLKKADPQHEDQYEQNCLVYLEKIQAIINKMNETFTVKTQEKAVIFHDSFAYLAQAVGIQVAHTIVMEEDTALSAGEIAEIIDEINTEKIHLLLTEEQFSNNIPASIAKETKATVYVIDSLVTGDPSADSYIKGMENNIAVLKQALDNLQ